MRTKNEMKDKLEEIEADERLHYPAALGQINAPLALIRVSLEARANLLRWVLGKKPFKQGTRYVRKT
jgi:hypothetical protein